MRQDVIRRVIWGATCVLWVLWAIGQAARDGFWLTALCFYIPSPFLATILLGMGVVHAVRGAYRRALLRVVLALPPLAFVVFVENHLFRERAPVAGHALRVVHWNVGETLGSKRTRRLLLAQQADLYVLSEFGNDDDIQGFRDALGAPYEAIWFDNMAVVGKGHVQSRGWLLNHRRALVHAVDWEYDGMKLRLFAVDLPSNVLVPRAPLLRQVMGLIIRDRPDLVLGDFNAPRRSRSLARLPNTYRHAYDSVGRGFGYTWPVPFPMYSLDQCIHAARIRPLCYGLVASFGRDHRCQVFDFSFEAMPDPADSSSVQARLNQFAWHGTETGAISLLPRAGIGDMLNKGLRCSLHGNPYPTR